MARQRSEALPQPRPYRAAHPRRLGLAPIDAARARDLLEILDDRFGRRSAIVTSQLPVVGWHRQLKDPSMADAILDRLVHGAIRFDLHGTSMRSEDAGAGAKQ